MRYVVFVGTNCHDCHLVKEFLDAENIEASIENIDTPNGVKPPHDVYALPALFIEGKLIAYGVDIIEKIKADRAG